MLTDLKIENAKISDAVPVVEKNKKIMYWNSIKDMKPVTATQQTEKPISEDEVGIPQKLDTLVKSLDGESSTLTSITGDKVVAATIETGAPDGTKYIKTGSYGNNKYGEYCLESECAYPAQYKGLTVMISLDGKI